jgi:P-type Ca2+ transporter type 2C
MAVHVEATGQPTAADGGWYAHSPEEVCAALDVDPAVGLTAARAGQLLSANGPNALPEEKPVSTTTRSIAHSADGDQYRLVR